MWVLGLEGLIESVGVSLIWCDCHVQETHNNTSVLVSEVSLNRTGCIIIMKKRNQCFLWILTVSPGNGSKLPSSILFSYASRSRPRAPTVSRALSISSVPHTSAA